MAVIESYPHGAPSWAELTTSDPEGAKKFYARLFGWEVEDVPMGEGEIYTMYKQQGEYVAASLRSDPRSDAPPRWQVYFNVADVDAATRLASELQGIVLVEPFDAFNAGRMSVVQDPQGAIFMLWQAKERKGAGRLDEPGALNWFELATSDAKAAIGFYNSLLGSTSALSNTTPEGVEYHTLSVAGDTRAGVLQMDDQWEGIPPHWTVYLGVDDMDAALTVVKEMGGELLTEPMDVPQGTFAVVRDPQGAVFMLFRR